MESDNIDKRFLQYWNNYKLKEGVLHRETNINGEKIEQLVLPASLAENIFRSYHDDLGHEVVIEQRRLYVVDFSGQE